jgi:hypothetical protein
MSHSHTLEAGMVSSGATLGGGVMIWLGENATPIGVICTITTLVLTAIFFSLNAYINWRGKNIDEEKLKRDIIESLISKADEEDRHVVEKLARLKK